jgi:hypothetical protein
MLLITLGYFRHRSYLNLLSNITSYFFVLFFYNVKILYYYSYEYGALKWEKPQKGKMVDIESLPDGFLLHILYFLNTYAAPRTSVLSKRWKDLWKFVPCVILDDVIFCDDERIRELCEQSAAFMQN